MTANTTNYTIPYPEITDFVKDGATAMENIAERVDDVLFAQVANRNLLYNGAMQIAQRATSVAGVGGSAGYFTVDRFRLGLLDSGARFTQAVVSEAPTGQGFVNSVKMTCTTAQASPAATTLLSFEQCLEGLDVQQIRKGTASARPLTLSFWVRSFQTGTFICELYDEANNRSVSRSYTVNSSATWEYKTITFPADTTGSLSNTNASMLRCTWHLYAGSTFTSGTLQTTWGTLTNANRAVGQVNLGSSTSNYWQITGTQLTIGSADTPFQFKPWQQELRECQRYYQRMQGAAAYSRFGMGSAEAANIANIIVPLWVTPRTTDTTAWTLSYSAIGTTGNRLYLSDGTAVFNITTLTLATVTSQRQLGLTCISAGLTTFRSYYFEESSTGDEWIAVSTEL